METMLCNVRVGGTVVDNSGLYAVIYRVTAKEGDCVSLTELGGSVTEVSAHTKVHRLKPSQAEWLSDLIRECGQLEAQDELTERFQDTGD